MENIKKIKYQHNFFVVSCLVWLVNVASKQLIGGIGIVPIIFIFPLKLFLPFDLSDNLLASMLGLFSFLLDLLGLVSIFGLVTLKKKASKLNKETGTNYDIGNRYSRGFKLTMKIILIPFVVLLTISIFINLLIKLAN